MRGLVRKTGSPEWEQAKADIRSLLVEAAVQKRTVSYSDVCETVTSMRLVPRSRELAFLLEEICTEEDARRGVMLASLVVHKGGDGMPGRGYFGHAEWLGRDPADRRAFWEGEVERVFAAFAAQ